MERNLNKYKTSCRIFAHLINHIFLKYKAILKESHDQKLKFQLRHPCAYVQKHFRSLS